MNDLDALKMARLMVKTYGDDAEAEINRRAEKALVDNDFDAFAAWGRVIAFVSDILDKDIS